MAGKVKSWIFSYSNRRASPALPGRHPDPIFADSAANARRLEPVAGPRVAFGRRAAGPGSNPALDVLPSGRLDNGPHFRSMRAVYGAVLGRCGAAKSTQSNGSGLDCSAFAAN
jgi:hypothetical protein